jgi:hypothetical protein
VGFEASVPDNGTCYIPCQKRLEPRDTRIGLDMASATAGASVGCHHTHPSDHDGVRGRAFGVSSPADWALGRVPSVTACTPHKQRSKHTDTGHPLPDFSLQNTCKFAIQSAAWLPALTTGVTQKDARALTHLFPPVLWSVACNIRMAEHGIWSVTIPVEGSPEV